MTTTHALTTIPTMTRWLGMATAVASLIAGGTLFAFSTFVMPGLHRLSAPEAVSAMQAINLQAPRSLLMLPLFGSAVGGVVLVILALTRPETPHRAWVIGGGVAAALTVVITAVYHVPHNNTLARLHPADSSTATAWADYYRGWLAWNHVRTLTAIGSGVALMLTTVRTAC